jgi:hypothetical protein
MLPAGPSWQCKPWTTSHHTKSPLQLFYRDPIECIESLLNSPLSANDIEFTPYKLYKTVEKSIRVYSEWLSGDVAWTMQVCTFLRNSRSLLGFVTGNPRVEVFNTVPMTRDTAPVTVTGKHRTVCAWVFLRCDDNPLRVEQPRV